MMYCSHPSDDVEITDTDVTITVRERGDIQRSTTVDIDAVDVHYDRTGDLTDVLVNDESVLPNGFGHRVWVEFDYGYHSVCHKCGQMNVV